MKLSNTFDNKGEVEIFNAYDPIRPPENSETYSILRYTIFILDEYKVTDMYSMKVIYKDINIICVNIFKNYKVINSNGTECKW
jgi:uridylate kinase